MTYRLADGVSFCRFEDRLIFLDLRRDRYCALPLPATLKPTEPLPVSVLTALAAHRLIMANTGQARAVAPFAIAIPDYSLVEAEGAAPLWRLAGRACIATLAAHRRVKAMPLHNIVQSIASARQKARERSSPWPLDRLVATFTGCRRLLPMPPRCLPDSLALLRFLLPFGHGPDLVFGVAAYPFAAHCWLQTEDRILNDSSEHVARFQPILGV